MEDALKYLAGLVNAYIKTLPDPVNVSVTKDAQFSVNVIDGAIKELSVLRSKPAEDKGAK